MLLNANEIDSLTYWRAQDICKKLSTFFLAGGTRREKCAGTLLILRQVKWGIC